MSSAAVRALSLEYKSLLNDPVEGFVVKLIKDDNLFEWEVGLFGPPQTLYEGGYFKVSGQKIFFTLDSISTDSDLANPRTFPPNINLESRCFVVVFIVYAVVGFAFCEI